MGSMEFKGALGNWDNDHLLLTKKFLPKIENGMYIVSSCKNKEQISFYYIPYMREWVRSKERKTLVETQTKTEKLSR